MPPRSDEDRVQAVAAGLHVLSLFLFDEALDPCGVAGVSALCQIMADELDRVQFPSRG